MAIQSNRAARRTMRPHGMLTPRQLNAFSRRLHAVRAPAARPQREVRDTACAGDARRWRDGADVFDVAMMANAMQGYREESRATAMHGYGTQPIRFEALVQALSDTEARLAP